MISTARREGRKYESEGNTADEEGITSDDEETEVMMNMKALHLYRTKKCVQFKKTRNIKKLDNTG